MLKRVFLVIGSLAVVFLLLASQIVNRAGALESLDLPHAVNAPDIVGGQNADPGEYPWQSLVIAGPFLCGGALIEAEWVLTAAHCVYGLDETLISPNDITVFLGEYDRSSDTNDGTEQKIVASQVIPLPDYQPGYHEHDIALIQLSRPATIVPGAVEPIALDRDRSMPAGTLATVTGWGQLVLNGENPSILQEVQVPIVTNQACNIAYGGSITVNMICAGEEEGGKDACLGDSGGPLVISDGQGRFEHAGIVSFGIGCADPRFPGVYTRTATYFTWIFNTMGISPDPTPTPTNTVQVTRTPSPIPPSTMTPTAAINSTPTPTPVNTATPFIPPTPTSTPLVSLELVTNGDFDGQPRGQAWVQASTNDFSLIDSAANFEIEVTPNSPPYFAWLGGRESEESRISQSITLPGDGRLSLRYRYLVTTFENRCGSDMGRILINTTIVETIDLCRDNASLIWREGFIPLDRFGNQDVTLSIEALNDVSDSSSLFIDDVSILYEADVQPIPTPTAVLLGGNAIQNGDFEAGNDQFWQVESANELQIILSNANNFPFDPVSGSHLAWLGGTNNEVGVMVQNYRPKEGVERIAFSYAILSEDQCGQDSAQITFNNVPLKTYDLCRQTETGGWVTELIDVSNFIGVNGDLAFQVTTDNLFNSSFFVDDVRAVGLDAPQSTPDPTSPNGETILSFPLLVQPGTRSVRLSWEAPNLTNIARYRIIRTSTSGSHTVGEPDLVAESQLPTFLDEDPALAVGTRYRYQVEALGTNGEQLGLSTTEEAFIGSVQLMIPELVGEANGQMIVPVNIVNGNGVEISEADIWIDYDSAVIEPIRIESRPLADGYEWQSNADNPIGIPGDTQRLKINITNTIPSPIYGSGSLFWITFDVVGEAGDRTELNLREYFPSIGGSTLQTVGEGDVPLFLIDGQVGVLAQNGADYQLGDVNGDGQVTLADTTAALAASSGGAPLQPIVVDAGDINGDQQLTASDGVQILTYLQTGSWPSGREPIIDVRSATGTNNVIFSLTDIVGQPGGNATIELGATGLEGSSALDLTLVYDTAVIDSLEDITLTGDAALFELFDYHVAEPGRIEVSFASRVPLEGNASLLELTVKIAADAPNRSFPPLYIANAQIASNTGLDFVTNFPGNSILLDEAQITLRKRAIYLPFLLND